MVQIKKLDRQVSTTGAEESQKSESSLTSKPKSSKGIVESGSKFETAKPNSLFQSSAYSTVRSAERKSESLVRNLNTERHSNSRSSTTSITDGTSNTIVVGEQNTASTPEAGTSLTGTASDHQQARLTTITDGTSNTIVVGEQPSTEATQEQSTNPPSQDRTPGTSESSTAGGGANVQNGSGESSPETSTIPSSQDQQPVTAKDGSTTIGTSGESQQGITVAIGDGSVRTIVPEGQGTESTPETSNGQQTNTTTITDGTSNTIVFGEQQSTEATSEASSDAENQDTQVDESTSS